MKNKLILNTLVFGLVALAAQAHADLKKVGCKYGLAQIDKKHVRLEISRAINILDYKAMQWGQKFTLDLFYDSEKGGTQNVSGTIEAGFNRYHKISGQIQLDKMAYDSPALLLKDNARVELHSYQPVGGTIARDLEDKSFICEFYYHL